MAQSRLPLILASVVVLGLLFVAVFVFDDKQYLLISLLIMATTVVPFFLRFEFRQVDGRELVLLAMLAAIAAVGRVPFAALPSVQPTTFVIIVSALVLGAESGFIIGAAAAIVSNIFLGQGPWTPWQMYAWGMTGLVAGSLRDTWWMQKVWGQCLFGFAVGWLFGWFMNLWFLLGFVGDLTKEAFISAYVASIYFDLAHALSNVFFLALFSHQWTKILRRFQRKYGLLEKMRT